MAKNIEPKLRKIGDYLKLEADTVFVIPEYQRAYSWNLENCDKLWQDLVDFADTKSKDSYFFGTIIVNCQEDDEEYGLIDGQQRTTTFFLLLKALLIRINDAILKTSPDEEAEALLRGLKERRRRIMGILYKAESESISDTPNKNRDTAISEVARVLVNRSINERYKSDLQKILHAYDFYEAEASATRIPYKQKDNKYTRFFRNFKFFYEKAGELSVSQLNYITKSTVDNCEVIEIKSWQVEQAITMFNSLNSDGLPLYDSDIISAKMYAAAEKQGEGKAFMSMWEGLLEDIAELKSKNVADIDSILMQEMYYIRAVKREIVTDTGTINVTTPGLRRYFTEINKDMINKPLETCSQMIKLVKIWKIVSSYPVTQILFKFNENSKLFLASYFNRFEVAEITEERIKDVINCLLRLFTVLELVDIGYSSSTFKTFLFGEEVKLTEKSVPESQIVDDFNNHIRTKWNRESIYNELVGYDRNVLVYLNEYLLANEKGLSFQLGEKYDIEHIMPASGNNLQEIRRDAGIESEEEFRSYVNRLGNKILLEERINRSIGNEWFRTKISSKLIEKTGYVDSIYPSAIELVRKYRYDGKPFWKKEDIEGATREAALRIVDYIFGEG